MPDLRANIRAYVESASVHNMPLDQATDCIMAVIADALDEVVSIEDLDGLHKSIAEPEEPSGPPNHWQTPPTG